MIPVTSPKTLGQVLKSYRKQAGLTQADVGHKFNIRQASISRIEAGAPGVSLATLFRLLSALELEMQLEPRDRANSDRALW